MDNSFQQNFARTIGFSSELQTCWRRNIPCSGRITFTHTPDIKFNIIYIYFVTKTYRGIVKRHPKTYIFDTLIFGISGIRNDCPCSTSDFGQNYISFQWASWLSVSLLRSIQFHIWDTNEFQFSTFEWPKRNSRLCFRMIKFGIEIGTAYY